MSKAKRRRQQISRVTFARTWPNGIPKSRCMSCGEPGPHFVPPSLGDEGFFHCTEHLENGKAVPNDVRERAMLDVSRQGYAELDLGFGLTAKIDYR